MTPDIRSRLARAGEKSSNWKGGLYQRGDGRWVQRVATGTYRLRYHIVWDEAHPDDPVRPGDVIHHINHDPSDDRPENLMKIRQGEHARHHFTGVPKEPEHIRKVAAASHATALTKRPLAPRYCPVCATPLTRTQILDGGRYCSHACMYAVRSGHRKSEW